MIALVTGSNGFIGSHLVEALLAKNYQVRCLVRKTSNLQFIKSLPVEFVYGELNDPSSLENATQKVDFVFHCAGVTRAPNRQGYINGNVTATRNLLNACEKSAAQNHKLVYLSSQAAAGPSSANHPITEDDPPNPISYYGESKLLAEKLVNDYGKNNKVTIIRPPSVYGPRDVDFLNLYKSIQNGISLCFGSGTQKMTIVYIDDLIQGVLRAAESEKTNGETLFICDATRYDWNIIQKAIATGLNKKPLTIPVPLGLIDFLSRVVCLFSKNTLLNRDKIREMYQEAWLCQSVKAKNMLNFQSAFTAYEGFKITGDWYKKQGWI